MRFLVEDVPPEYFPRNPEVGDVYSAKGGTGTSLWVCVSHSGTGQSGHYLGIDEQGHIVSTASYGHHAMRNRALVGRVDLAELTLAIQAP